MEILKLIVGIMFISSGGSVLLRINKLKKKYPDLQLPTGQYYSMGIGLIVVGLCILFN